MTRRVFWFLALILLVSTAFAVSKDNYFPTDKWRTSTPEAQGIDSNELTKIVTEISQNENGYS